MVGRISKVAVIVLAIGLFLPSAEAKNTREPLELGACTTYRALGRYVCAHRPTRTRVPYYSRVSVIRKVQKFIPKTSVRKPVVFKGKKMNKRSILRLYRSQNER